MIKSMTGYGRAEETVEGCTITVELRSVNNRYLDCNVRMPRLYLFQLRLSQGTFLCSVGTAGVEYAARGRIHGGWKFSL